MTGAAARVATVVVAAVLLAGLAGCDGSHVSASSSASADTAGAPTARAAPMPQDVAQGGDDPELTAAVDDAEHLADAAETDLADADG